MALPEGVYTCRPVQPLSRFNYIGTSVRAVGALAVCYRYRYISLSLWVYAVAV